MNTLKCKTLADIYSNDARLTSISIRLLSRTNVESFCLVFLKLYTQAHIMVLLFT